MALVIYAWSKQIMIPVRRNNLKRASCICALLPFCVSMASHLAWAKHPHPYYKFILPDKYVGWIQIVFNDPTASPLPLKNRGFEIEVPESGIARTSYLRVEDFKSNDEFCYRSVLPNGTSELRPVPSEYVMLSDIDSHGGFGVMDTGGKGPGYSWFIFIGPPELRAKVPLADWDKVESWKKIHGNYRVEAADRYPTPGRMSSVPSSQEK
jgi:hypothetical protein